MNRNLTDLVNWRKLVQDQACLSSRDRESSPESPLGLETRLLLMFVRKVVALLKPNSISKFSLLMEKQVIPLLRNQTGFQDELTFYPPAKMPSPASVSGTRHPARRSIVRKPTWPS